MDGKGRARWGDAEKERKGGERDSHAPPCRSGPSRLQLSLPPLRPARRLGRPVDPPDTEISFERLHPTSLAGGPLHLHTPPPQQPPHPPARTTRVRPLHASSLLSLPLSSSTASTPSLCPPHPTISPPPTTPTPSQHSTSHTQPDEKSEIVTYIIPPQHADHLPAAVQLHKEPLVEVLGVSVSASHETGLERRNGVARALPF